MWLDCFERKRNAKLPWSATAPCTFAAAPSFQACLRAFHMYILYVCVCKCVCVYVCGHVYMYIYACVYVFVHLCVHTHVYVYVYADLFIDCGVLVSVFQRVDGVMHTHVFLCAYVCSYICMWPGIYICAFFCGECYMHFTDVLGTSAWAGLYVTQVCFYTNLHICKHTRCRLCTYVYM